MDIVLEQAHEVRRSADGGGAAESPSSAVQDKIVFGPDRYVSLQAVDVDLDYATKGER